MPVCGSSLKERRRFLSIVWSTCNSSAARAILPASRNNFAPVVSCLRCGALDRGGGQPARRTDTHSGSSLNPVTLQWCDKVMSGCALRANGVPEQPGRVRYRVTLVCGCFWWENRDVDAAPPKPPVCRCERHDGTMSKDVLQVPVLSRQHSRQQRFRG